jgi:hypothetical protein
MFPVRTPVVPVMANSTTGQMAAKLVAKPKMRAGARPGTMDLVAGDHGHSYSSLARSFVVGIAIIAFGGFGVLSSAISNHNFLVNPLSFLSSIGPAHHHTRTHT